MLILSIETSCDDTAIAVLEARGAKQVSFNILASLVSSQNKIHAPYGGVVPNLAARAHQKNLPIALEKVYDKVLKAQILIRQLADKSQINPKFQILNSKPKIDLIAVTVGPGLEPSLWAGVNFAKSLSLISDIPIIGVNHIEGHISANFLVQKIGGNSKFPRPFWRKERDRQIPDSKQVSRIFPALCLIVSGGHTQLILMKNRGDYKLLGETRDDATGEAFDKVAKLLNLGYPGGPAVAAEAAKFSNSPRPFGVYQKSEAGKFQNANSKFQIKLPRPMINSNNYDFSFSGLKTAALYKIQEFKKSKKFQIPDSRFQKNICAEFQQAVIDVLIHKTLRAAKKYNIKTILCGGGVMANRELRKQLKMAVQKELPQIVLRIPPTPLCTDNAAMIAAAGYYKYLRHGVDNLKKVEANANLEIF